MSTEGKRDIRWIQRFQNFNKAFAQLTKFIEKGDLNEFEEQGFIKAFEYTYELAWNTIKDFYKEQGETGIQGSRDAFRLAFKRELVSDGQTWMDMIEDRKLTVHTYNEETVASISKNIKAHYYNLFGALQESLEAIKTGKQSEF